MSASCPSNGEIEPAREWSRRWRAGGVGYSSYALDATPMCQTRRFARRRVGGMLLRAGAPLQSILSVERFLRDDRYPYLQRMKSAGGFKQYEARVKKSLAAMLVPKFPQIPAEVPHDRGVLGARRGLLVAR